MQHIRKTHPERKFANLENAQPGQADETANFRQLAAYPAPSDKNSSIAGSSPLKCLHCNSKAPCLHANFHLIAASCLLPLQGASFIRPVVVKEFEITGDWAIIWRCILNYWDALFRDFPLPHVSFQPLAEIVRQKCVARMNPPESCTHRGIDCPHAGETRPGKTGLTVRFHLGAQRPSPAKSI